MDEEFVMSLSKAHQHSPNKSSSVRRITDYHDDVRRFEDYCRLFTEWDEKHKEVLKSFKIITGFQEFTQAVQQLKEKEEKKRMDVVVIGTTSSGKSLLINSLIRHSLMRAGLYDTTPCAVLIQTTEESIAYYVSSTKGRTNFNLESEDELEQFQDAIDNVVEGHSEELIELNVPGSFFGSDTILSANCTLLDSPGMEQHSFWTEDTKMKVNEADTLILVIDVSNGFNRDSTRKLLYDSGFFIKPNVLVVYNKCDELSKKERPARANQIIKVALKDVIEFLTRENGPYATEEEARRSVFFVSCEEIRSNQEQETEECNNGKTFERRETDNRYSTDKTKRSAEFRSFEESLLSLAKSRREKTKADRLQAAVQENTLKLTVKAQEVNVILNDVWKRLQRSLVQCNREEIYSHFSEFILVFYSNETPNGEVSFSGKEKVEKFFTYMKEKGYERIRSNVLACSESLDPRLEDYISWKLRELIDEVVEVEKNICIEKFSHLLEPIDGEIYDQLFKKIEEIENEIKAKTENDEIIPKELMKRLKKLRKKIDDRLMNDDIDNAHRDEELEHLEKVGIGEGIAYAFVSASGAGLAAAAIGTALVASGPVGWAVGGVLMAASAVTLIASSITGSKLTWGRMYRQSVKTMKNIRDLLENLKEKMQRKREQTEADKKELQELNIDYEINELKRQATGGGCKRIFERRKQHIGSLVFIIYHVNQTIIRVLSQRFNNKCQHLAQIAEDLANLIPETTASGDQQ